MMTAEAQLALAVPTVFPMSALDVTAIQEIRGERVMVDADLAALFNVETRVFNQAFKRNQDRFPASWAFELTEEEWENLRSQFVMSSWGGRRSLPWVICQQTHA